MKAETRKKIASCKALQGMTIGQLISSERFLQNLAAYLKSQQEDRLNIKKSYGAMHKLGTAAGYRLPSHPVDYFLEWDEKRFAAEYARILDKRSELSCNLREYVRQLGGQAYNLTVAQIAVEEFPELKDELFPKAN